MKTSRNFLHSCISLGLLLSLASSPALGVQTRESISNKTAQLNLIEQPLMRIGMKLGGVALIGILISSAIEAGKKESDVSNQGASLDQQTV